MKIAVSALQVDRNNSGIGMYIINLIGMMTSNYPEDYLIYHSRGIEPTVLFPGEHVAFREICSNKQQFIRRNIFEIFQFATDVRQYQADVFFAPDSKLPFGLPKQMRKIVTVHDLAVFKFPETYQRSRVLYWQQLFASSVRRADRVVAISEATKRDLQEILRVPEEKIKIIYNGVCDEFKKPASTIDFRRIREKYRLPENYILFVGIFSPRKNLTRLIEAFSELRHQYRLPHKLVIAGETGWKYHDDLARVAKLGLENQIYFPGYIDEADLPHLYAMADALAYPSLYEGFGLPLVEAMACGTPVVASRTSSMPEVVGNAGLLVDPYSVQEICDALAKVLIDRKLHDQLTELGLERVKRFSWQKAAGQLHELMSDLD